MADPDTHAEIMRAIVVLDQELPATWAGPSMWADMVQEAAQLIVEIGDRLQPMQLAVVMTLGAMAHRQCKIESAANRESSV